MNRIIEGTQPGPFVALRLPASDLRSGRLLRLGASRWPRRTKVPAASGLRRAPGFLQPNGPATGQTGASNSHLFLSRNVSAHQP